MTKEYSDYVLDEVINKAIRFLLALANDPLLVSVMGSAGLMKSDITDGSNKVKDCVSDLEEICGIQDTQSAQKHREAVGKLDQIDEILFARSKGPLRRFYPSTAKYLFRDLKASRGPMAVKGVATYLARLVLLEDGTDPSREGQFENDKAAVELLAQRGIDADERRRLQELVDVALAPTDVSTEYPQIDPEVIRARKIALKEWYDDWATTARAVIKKRSHLIKLGLAKRRKRAPKKEETEE